MNTLSFRQWLEANVAAPQQDQNLKAAGQAAVSSAVLAQKRGKNPIQAAQQAVLQKAAAGQIPANKLGQVLPKDPDQTDDV